jgi:hypothetical protein
MVSIVRAFSRLDRERRLPVLQKRPIGGWGILALFSIIAVMGEALHVLPGMGHSCRMLPHGRGECHVHCAAVAGFPADLPALCAADHEEQISCENCPICQYFSQAKSLLVLSDCAYESLPIYAQFTALPLIFFQGSLSAYQSRGPPAGLWIS